MGALQYTHVPGYAALLLRRTYPELTLPKSLMDVAFQWLRPTNAQWRADTYTWHFKTGFGKPDATLTFGHLNTEQDKYRYQSSEFQYIGFDELTEFTESQYRFLFSRLRRNVSIAVPLRMRASSNPGGIGHNWVRKRFILDQATNRAFIKAQLEDNPFIDREEYEESLNELDAITRARLRHGNWEIRPEGNLFKRAWFHFEDRPPARLIRQVRYWDLAATEPAKGRDPDWTVGVKMGIDEFKVYHVIDVRRFQMNPRDVERLIRQTARSDGYDVSIRIEQEGGASGKSLIDHFMRNVLDGFDVRPGPAVGDKLARANPYSAACERGDVRLKEAAWNDDYLDELCAFTGGKDGHDDQVDASAGAFGTLSREPTEAWNEEDVAAMVGARRRRR
jgi:predicted phage terminase large subunit-like protein